jgi:hypothetical protein
MCVIGAANRNRPTRVDNSCAAAMSCWLVWEVVFFKGDTIF